MTKPEQEEASIVMLGAFNPSIFQPRWLGAQGLIRPEEAANARIEIVQNDIADFRAEWFHLQAIQGRFLISSSDPRQYGPLRDLGHAIFTILPHTPIRALGLNRGYHYPIESPEVWHAIGHRLAPKQDWNSIMDGPGLRSMTMQGQRKVNDGGVLRLKVESSTRIPQALYIEVNEEFNAPKDLEADGAKWVPGLIVQHWDAIMDYAETAAGHLLGMV